jgi:hypothetical protein
MPDPDSRGKAMKAVENIHSIIDLKPEYGWSVGGDEVVVDLLTDLRHYCQCHNIDFDGEFTMSEHHYEAERIKRFPARIKRGC